MRDQIDIGALILISAMGPEPAPDRNGVKEFQGLPKIEITSTTKLSLVTSVWQPAYSKTTIAMGPEPAPLTDGVKEIPDELNDYLSIWIHLLFCT